jgi:serine/threonine-protein kinase
MTLFGVWALVTVAAARLLQNERWANWGQCAWMGTDVILLTILLKLSHGPASPLVSVYLLQITGAGLWSRVRLIWFTTAIAEAGYAFLALDAYLVQPEVQFPHRYFLFMVAMAVQAFAVAHQVRRLGALRRYCEQRTPP